MIFTIARHCQVLMEVPESIVHREEHPRAKPRYFLACTCKTARRANGHCVHTLAIFQDHIQPGSWKRIALEEMMPAENGKTGKRERSRLDLERELTALRKQLRQLQAANGEDATPAKGTAT